MENQPKRNYCESHMGILLQKLVLIKRISSKFAESVKIEYIKFFEVVDRNLQSFSCFNPSKDRVDRFFANLMRSLKPYENLWEFIKMFLVLYHGQSAIERGFSINKQLLVEDLKPESLVVLQTVEDHMRYLELSLEIIRIPNKMIQYVKQAHSRYQSELSKQRTERKTLTNHWNVKLLLMRSRQ